MPFNLWTELEGWGWGGGLFGLREGRLFVPHGQKLAVWLKKLDLHQLFMHFPREAVTACTLWLNVGGGQDELIGQAGACGRNFGVVTIKALTQEAVSSRGNECSHNKSKWMNGLVRLGKELRCGEY